MKEACVRKLVTHDLVFKQQAVRSAWGGAGPCVTPRLSVAAAFLLVARREAMSNAEADL